MQSEGVEVSDALPAEPSRDSISSTGSWIRRLSRPLSHHGSSPRSSLIPDYQSAFSNGSAAPMLQAQAAAPQLPPNKLVKRSSSIRNAEVDGIQRSKSRSHLPSLRRPATSHQRSATLQQQMNLNLTDGGASEGGQSPKYSFDRQSMLDVVADGHRSDSKTRTASWLSFFHSKTAASTNLSSSFADEDRHIRAGLTKRVHTRFHSGQLPHLVKPDMLLPSTERNSLPWETSLAAQDDVAMVDSPVAASTQPSPTSQNVQIIDPEDQRPPTRNRMKRSLSWVAHASGSIRRAKRATGAGGVQRAGYGGSGAGQPTNSPTSGEVRHVSAPVTGRRSPVGHLSLAEESLHWPIVAPISPASAASGGSGPLEPSPGFAPSAVHGQAISNKRHCSSPLPPLSALQNSTGAADSSRFRIPSAPVAAGTGAFAAGSVSSSRRSSGVTAAAPTLQPQRASGSTLPTHAHAHANAYPLHLPYRPIQPSGSSISSAAMSQRRASQQNDKTEVFDADARGFVSADEDDTDFKSDTLYDSLRTIASSRTRAVETPLESVYDESPPSTADNSKTKKLAMHDALGRPGWDEAHDKIAEEEELQNYSSSRQISSSSGSYHDASMDLRNLDLNRRHPSAQIASDTVRASMDVDSDDDWARDDESDGHFNALSPPSKESSLNSRSGRMNPNVRLALANIGNSSLNECNNAESAGDRPLSNIFDWSDQTLLDKHDAERRSGRPQTAYTKQTLDPRGGRSAIRKGPAPAHVRSQSVPVVNENPNEAGGTGAKYGTWGLSSKMVSEDWDEDFEFGLGAMDENAKEAPQIFAVPESIRASQLSVRAHSGQIRELSLLVNDLKRLCRHGRELDLLSGSHKELWKEAEGVIALASPDDDLEDNSEPQLPPHKTQDKKTATATDGASDDGQARTAKNSPNRRRSVFGPDDDIFGGSVSGSTDDAISTYTANETRPYTPDTKRDAPTGVVKTVMEAMQGRVHSGSVLDGPEGRKVQFDTNSLKALVRRSSELRDILSDLVRKVDQLTESPIRPSRYERGVDSSPAFTRVFDDPGSSPPRRSTRSRGNTLRDNNSPESSPPRAVGRRFPLMTVR